MDDVDRILDGLKKPVKSMETYLTRYKSLLVKISKVRWDTDTSKLQAKARHYLDLALKAGYDPVLHMEIYRSI